MVKKLRAAPRERIFLLATCRNLAYTNDLLLLVPVGASWPDSTLFLKRERELSMAKQISLGIMEQAVMRQEAIDENERAEIKHVVGQVTHVEGKYIGTLGLLKERVKNLGDDKPVILHAQYPAIGDDILNMANPAFQSQLGDEFRTVLEMFEPEWYSFHLGFSCEDLKSGGQFDFATARSEVLPEDVVRQKILENMEFVKSTYPAKNTILLENLDYNPVDKSGAYEYVCDPVFVTDILEKTGCGMLMDIGHMNCSAQNMGFGDVVAFASKFPLEKVVEIHMSGAGEKDGLAHDTHHPLTKPGQRELEYLEELLKSGRLSGLRAVTLETFEQLDPQLDALKAVIERTGHIIGSL